MKVGGVVAGTQQRPEHVAQVDRERLAKLGHHVEHLNELDAVVGAESKRRGHRPASWWPRRDHAFVPCAKECSAGGTTATPGSPEACTTIDSRSPPAKRPAIAARPSARSMLGAPCKVDSVTDSAILRSMPRAPEAAASTR